MLYNTDGIHQNKVQYCPEKFCSCNLSPAVKLQLSVQTLKELNLVNNAYSEETQSPVMTVQTGILLCATNSKSCMLHTHYQPCSTKKKSITVVSRWKPHLSVTNSISDYTWNMVTISPCASEVWCWITARKVSFAENYVVTLKSNFDLLPTLSHQFSIFDLLDTYYYYYILYCSLLIQSTET